MKAHNHFADFRGADHQRTQMGGVKRNRDAAPNPGSPASNRRTPRQLAQFAGDLTSSVSSNRCLMIEAITADHIDFALDHEPSRREAPGDTRCVCHH
jgi:hypothetical protein